MSKIPLSLCLYGSLYTLLFLLSFFNPSILHAKKYTLENMA